MILDQFQKTKQFYKNSLKTFNFYEIWHFLRYFSASQSEILRVWYLLNSC